MQRAPNFLGDFVARTAQVGPHGPTTLTYTGAGAEGFTDTFVIITPPITANGPGGPFTLNTPIPYPPGGPFPLAENGELTALVRAQFPGATFLNGGGEDQFTGTIPFFYNYLTALQATVNLPNPSGGGLVGRNNYFDNGSPRPQDRVYFFYNHVGDVQGLGPTLDVNRYVFGAEKTFLDGRCSLELRVPFAGTASSVQAEGAGLTVDHLEFGNLGLLLRGVAYQDANFLLSVGLGVSVPTARDSRLLLEGQPFVAIDNRACLIQPVVGAIWAPNDRFYAQAGLQFDLDPTGNPVRALNAAGGLSRVGVLDDQGYAFLSTAVGYWAYANPGARLSGVALQGELHCDRSFGPADSVHDGSITITEQGNNLNVFDATACVICRFGDRTDLSLGVSLPLGGDHLYSWNLIAQVNWQFGGPR